MTRLALVVAVCVACVAIPSGQGAPPMTNQDVVKMVAAGLAEDVIVTAIRQAPSRTFDLTPTGLIDLKLAHVSDPIVRAMQAADNDGGSHAPAPRPAPTTSSEPPSSPPSAAPSERVVSSLPPTPASPPAAASVQEPTALGELYAISRPTGGLVSLERVQMKERKVGNVRSQGVFKPAVQDFAYYFEGASSPVTLHAGEPQKFAIRLLGSDRGGKPATAEEAQKHFLLTKLQSEEGRRYITRVDAQFDVRTYGMPAPGLDPRKPDQTAVSFELTPRSPLGPGEYVILLAGTHNFQFIGNYQASSDRWAFAIPER